VYEYARLVLFTQRDQTNINKLAPPSTLSPSSLGIEQISRLALSVTTEIYT
jgi:hypothetical protein